MTRDPLPDGGPGDPGPGAAGPIDPGPGDAGAGEPGPSDPGAGDPGLGDPAPSDFGSNFYPPPVFDAYRIIRALGRGAMGEVYLAHDTVLDRRVAVKFIVLLDPNASLDEAARKRFMVEAQAAARVQHPNVLTIYGVGELEDRPYIVSEFLRGHSLDQVSKPMPWADILKIGVDLSRGLAAAHRCGVLHRDIKPSNAIITDDGTVKLLDFGIAKIVGIGAVPDEPVESATISHRSSSSPPALSEPPVSSDPEARVSPATVTVDMGKPSSSRATPNNLGRPPPPPPSPAELAATIAALNERVPHKVGLVTPASVIRGTPYYMAPEIWRGEPATRRSDVYSLGALLFELCTGDPPHKRAAPHELPRVAMTRDVRSLASGAPASRRELAAIIDRCLRRDPAARFASGDEVRNALEQLLLAAPPIAAPEGNPYRGLLPFEAEHRALFFGRSNEVGTLLERVRAEPFVLVAGDSGVGKSSLCRAGVLPFVVDGALGGGRAWSTIELVPGATPLATLSSALAGVLGMEADAVQAAMTSQPAALARDLSRVLGDARGIIFFVDQLEELVTISPPEEAAVVGRMLAALATRAPGIRLLMTARSDFLARLASVPGIGDELTHALYLLRPLGPSNIEQAIVGPARVKGVAFESEGLVQSLVESTAHTEGSLPLLQFALAELWQARSKDGSTITAEALSAIGGINGALARHADEVLLHLQRPEQREAARRILVALVTLAGTRARRSERELMEIPNAAAALKVLVDGRLLVTRDTARGIAYELAHEALLKGWSTLREWLDQHADGRLAKERLALAVAEWEKDGRKDEDLWSAYLMAKAALIEKSELSEREAAFLNASRRAIRRKKIIQYAVLVGAPVTLLLMTYGAVETAIQRDRDQAVAVRFRNAEHEIEQARAGHVTLDQRRAEAFAAFDANDVKKGEELWAEALELASKIDRGFERASRELEGALTVDAARTDVRDRLAYVLYERALAASRDHAVDQSAELLQRLALYDTNKVRQRDFHAPGYLHIESNPPGAVVKLEHYRQDPDGKRRTDMAEDLGTTPIERTRDIAPGSYRLTLTSPGRVTIVYPLMLARDEHLDVAVYLPLASEVPDGFAYIPHGRFRFGTSTDEALRRFLLTVPEHEVVLQDDYLIAKHETTYADWITYLNALPREMRASRRPNAGDGGLIGHLELREIKDGEWNFTFQPPGTTAYSTREGAPLAYANRSNRVSQPWERLPVSGVTGTALIEYTDWLDATQRVPGARLCTEYEWERAARGADDREFPSGDRLEATDANFDETYGGIRAAMGPDAVGSYPASRSPFDIDDMVGNIFEWTQSKLSAREYVVRGGSYFYSAFTNMSTNRSPVEPTVTDPNFGVRICAPVLRR